MAKGSDSSKAASAGPPSTWSPREEARMVEACQKGDARAFEELVDRFQGVVYGLAFQMVHNREEAEDVAQEVFLRCYRALPNFRAESRLSTWLYRITVNTVKNHWAWQQRRQKDRHQSLDEGRSAENENPLDPASPAPGPGDRALWKEQGEMLQEAVRRLPEDQQLVVVLRFMQHLSYEEIGEALECSLGTVKSRINRARARLKEILTEMEEG